MKRTVMLSTLVTFTIQMAGCPQTNDGSARTSPSGPVVVGTEAFSVTLPDSAKMIDVGVGIPGATFFEPYEDDLGYLYGVFTIPSDALVGFSSPAVGASSRFDGVGRTSSGDFVIFATTHGDTGDLCSLFAQLSDGQLLYVASDCTNPVRLNVFGSVDLAGTDGTGLTQGAKEGVPLLLNPPRDGVVVLDDNFAYRVSGAVNIRQVSAWNPGDSIGAFEAGKFSPTGFDPFFLVQVGEWRSVRASFIGTARRANVAAVTDVASGVSTITLSDGSVWNISASDRPSARTWANGDAVALLQDSGSPLGFTIVHLPSGDAIVVGPR